MTASFVIPTPVGKMYFQLVNIGVPGNKNPVGGIKEQIMTSVMGSVHEVAHKFIVM